MKTKSLLALLAGLVLASASRAQVPQLINYQGRVLVGNANFNGNGQFKFALVNGNGSVTFWSNDGTSVAGSQPAVAVSLNVDKGLYSVLLGDATLPNMIAIPFSVFGNSDVRLRIWFNDGQNGFQQFSPDQRIASVGYAMMSANVADGAITESKLANGAVTAAKIGPDAIGAMQIAPGAVNSSDIADNSILGTDIADGTIQTADLANNAVTQPKIAANAINSSHIQDGTITAQDIAPNAITSDQLEDKLVLGSNGLSVTNGSATIAKLYEAYSLGGTPRGGYFYLRDSSAGAGLALQAEGTAAAGEITVFNDSGDETVEILGRTTTGAVSVGSQLRLKRSDGKTSAALIDGFLGGVLNLYAGDGDLGVAVSGFGAGQGGEISVYDAKGKETVEIRGSEGGSDGSQIEMRNSLGNRTVQLDAEASVIGGGGFLALYKGDGSASITLSADQTGEGRITTQVLQITGGSDLSEQFDVNAVHDALKPGMVVSIDPQNPGELRLSARAYDRAVAGVLSGAGGVKPGMLMGQAGTAADGKHPVALTGRVYCQADASHGAIQPGDLLTTSDRPGHAMKVTDHAQANGAIIGKAMTSLESGQGLVLVLVSLQ